jgi:hypothetical protein
MASNRCTGKLRTPFGWQSCTSNMAKCRRQTTLPTTSDYGLPAETVHTQLGQSCLAPCAITNGVATRIQEDTSDGSSRDRKGWTPCVGWAYSASSHKALQRFMENVTHE